MSEAPDKKSGAFGDKRYKARWVLPRRLGGRHIGLYRGKPLSVPVGLWPRENAALLPRRASLK